MGNQKDNVTGSIILFDGVCNLCNASVQFIIKRDVRSHFKFASLQSATGTALLKHHKFATDKLYSVILVEDEKIYDRSGAALRIARRLDGFWSVFYLLIIIPPFIRDFIYDWISKNRYRWFGKRNECMIPTADLRSRFI